MSIFKELYAWLTKIEWRISEKIAATLGFTAIKETKFGIKSINCILKNYNLQCSNIIYVDAEKLYLGFDALKDTYSLCGVNILNSPHYELMKTIEAGDDVSMSDYCKRCEKGALDGRSAIHMNRYEIERLKEFYKQRKTSILENSIGPAQVYKINGQYYLADGKHRAALAASLGLKIRCVEISSDFLKDSYRMWIYRKMIEKKELYKLNILLIDKIMEN